MERARRENMKREHEEIARRESEKKERGQIEENIWEALFSGYGRQVVGKKGVRKGGR